jgi:shikimate kinase
VIATGGGAVLRGANRVAMRERNLVVWLDPPPETLARRLATHERGEVRPLLAGDTLVRLQQLHAQRCDLYAEAAHLHLSDEQAGGDRDEVVAWLVAAYREWQRKGTSE